MFSLLYATFNKCNLVLYRNAAAAWTLKAKERKDVSLLREVKHQTYYINYDTWDDSNYRCDHLQFGLHILARGIFLCKYIDPVYVIIVVFVGFSSPHLDYINCWQPKDAIEEYAWPEVVGLLILWCLFHL